jgi:predicted 3-demethylubiquinone-9 3-methyltransferase (glyoxalase superfamily)
MQKITPFLWFDGKAEEAAIFYVSIFKNSKMGKLSAAGTKQQCGWLQDKFGVSWQIVPTALAKLMSDPDREKTGRVMQALMQMNKIDIARLEQAYHGRRSG